MLRTISITAAGILTSVTLTKKTAQMIQSMLGSSIVYLEELLSASPVLWFTILWSLVLDWWICYESSLDGNTHFYDSSWSFLPFFFFSFMSAFG